MFLSKKQSKPNSQSRTNSKKYDNQNSCVYSHRPIQSVFQSLRNSNEKILKLRGNSKPGNKKNLSDKSSILQDKINIIQNQKNQKPSKHERKFSNIQISDINKYYINLSRNNESANSSISYGKQKQNKKTKNNSNQASQRSFNNNQCMDAYMRSNKENISHLEVNQIVKKKKSSSKGLNLTKKSSNQASYFLEGYQSHNNFKPQSARGDKPKAQNFMFFNIDQTPNNSNFMTNNKKSQQSFKMSEINFYNNKPSLQKCQQKHRKQSIDLDAMLNKRKQLLQQNLQSFYGSHRNSFNNLEFNLNKHCDNINKSSFAKNSTPLAQTSQTIKIQNCVKEPSCKKQRPSSQSTMVLGIKQQKVVWKQSTTKKHEQKQRYSSKKESIQVLNSIIFSNNSNNKIQQQKIKYNSNNYNSKKSSECNGYQNSNVNNSSSILSHNKKLSIVHQNTSNNINQPSSNNNSSIINKNANINQSSRQISFQKQIKSHRVNNYINEVEKSNHKRYGSIVQNNMFLLSNHNNNHAINANNSNNHSINFNNEGSNNNCDSSSNLYSSSSGFYNNNSKRNNPHQPQSSSNRKSKQKLSIVKSPPTNQPRQIKKLSFLINKDKSNESKYHSNNQNTERQRQTERQKRKHQTLTIERKDSCNNKSVIQKNQQLEIIKYSPNSFEYQCVVGKGGFGKVWKVHCKRTGTIFALKQMSKALIISKKSVPSVMNQQELLKNLKNPFLVNMCQSFQTRQNLYLLMDFLSGGDLRHHLAIKRYFSQDQTKFIIICILFGLKNLHENHIIHRDIKPENIVLDEKGYARITDLGVARKWRQNNSCDTSGTPGYMAPEVLCRQNHSYQADYFAVGVIAYELMLRKRPYYGRSRKQIRDQVLAKQVQIKRQQIPDNWSIQGADFINRMIQRKPSNRLGYNGISQIFNHPWINGFPLQRLYKKRLQAPYMPSQTTKQQNIQNYTSSEDTQMKELIQQNQIMLRSKQVQNLFIGYQHY